MKDLSKPLDVRNLGCPVPAINLRKALRKMTKGQEITVLCNALEALKDLKAVIQDTGAVLISEIQDDSGKVPVWTLRVQRGL